MTLSLFLLYVTLSTTNYIELGTEGDGNPVEQGGGPLQLLYHGHDSVGEYGGSGRPWQWLGPTAASRGAPHGGEVTNQGLGVVIGGANMAGAVGGLGDGVDSGLVVVELHN